MNVQLGIVGLLIVACGCAGSAKDPDPRVVELLGGEAAFQTISHPTKVEIVRIKVTDENEAELSVPAWTVKRIDEYPLGEPIKLDNDASKEFSSVFATSRTYRLDDKSRKGCKPVPGVAVRFYTNDSSVDVLICFWCKMLTTLNRDEPHWVDFDPGEARLINLVKKQFPNDSKIQELTPSR